MAILGDIPETIVLSKCRVRYETVDVTRAVIEGVMPGRQRCEGLAVSFATTVPLTPGWSNRG
jgi:hypothetical protein